MKTKKRIVKDPLQIRKYAIYSAILWTILIFVLLQFDINIIKQEALHRAEIYTRVGFDKDIIYRRWASEHGGVYVKADSFTPPNPYLSHIPNRDIVIDSNLTLTLINPAYMTRQVYELEEVVSDNRGHITSLNPVRPENNADIWETKVLKAFEDGTTEYSEVSGIDGKDYFRFMKPFVTENSCLKCHAHQGYKVGDIRGGISVSYPLDQVYFLTNKDILALYYKYSIIWILGISIIIVAFLRIMKSDNKRLVAEDGLRNLNAELEERVETRTKKLNNEINMHKRTEKELHESEEKFRTLYNNSPDMYVSVSPEDASILQCNDTLLKTTGYLREEIIGAPIFKIYHDDCMKDVKKAFQQFVETGEVSGKELILKRKDGSTIDVSLNVNAVKDETGQIMYSISSWRDITGQNLAIKALFESEKRFRLLYENAPLAYQSLNTEGCLIDVNPTWLYTLDYKREEVLGKHFGEFMTPESAEFIKTRFPRFMAEGEIHQAEFEMLRKDGSSLFVSYEGKVGNDEFGNFKQTHCIFSDITERKQAADALKRSEYLLNETQRITKLGGWEYDVASNQTYFSDEVFNIYGIEDKKMFAPEAGVNFYHQDDRKLVMDSFTSAITNAEPYDLEVRFINAHKKNMWVRTAGKPIVENEKVVKVIGSLMDITENKLAEEELKQYREQLEELVKERTKEIDEKNKALERINKLFIGRELRMKELKKEIENLKGTSTGSV